MGGCDVALEAEAELEATVQGGVGTQDDVGGLRCSPVRRTARPRAWVRADVRVATRTALGHAAGGDAGRVRAIAEGRRAEQI